MSGKGYIGKISAIVTVNTADAERAFNKSAKDAQNYGAGLKNTIERATRDAGKSFENIFTPLQKVERALQAASGRSFSLYKQEDVARIRQLVSASEQLAKPLSVAAKQVSGLSAEVQGEFLGALVSAQKATAAVRGEIDRLGSVGEQRFDAVARKVKAATEATNRLEEASAAVAGLATGRELRFAQPSFTAQTARAARLQQQAAALAPDQIDGSAVGSLVARQRQAAEEAERLLARLDAIRVTRRGDAAEAQSAYSRQIALLRQVNDELEREVSLSRQLTNGGGRAAQEEAAFRARAADEAEREARALEQLTQSQNRLLRAEADRRSGAAAQRNAAAFDAATESVMRAPQRDAEVLIGRRQRTVDSVRAEIRQLDQELQRLPQVAQDALQGDAERLNSIAEAARSGSAGLGTLIDQYERFAVAVRAVASEEERRQSSLRDANSRLNVLQDESAQLSQRGAIGGPQEPPLPPGFGGRSDAGLGLAADDSQRQLELLRAGIVSVKGQLDQLPAGLRQQFIPAIVAAEAELRRLSAAPTATADQIENARNELDRLSQGAQRAAQSLTLPSFGELVNTSSIRQSTAELEALGRILQRVGAEAGGPAAAAYDRLQQRTQEAIRTGTTGLPAVRRELEALQREAAEAAAQTGRISAGAAFREIQRTGDVARGAFGNVGLAVQQAAFAFEDFFSVTGGLDQRIRAAGNNLSQLGFILGGTTGLFVGIGAAITGQALVALVNWYNGGRTAEDQTKSLNDALARQKSLVEELANAFNSLGDSIARRAFSAPAQQARQFSKELTDLSNQQRELRERELAAFDPDVQRQRAEQSRIQRELGDASSTEEILRLQRQLRTAQRRERAITQGLAAGVPRTDEQRGRAIGGLEQVFRDVADRTFRTGGVARPVAIEQARANISTLRSMGVQEQVNSLRGQQRYIEEDARAGRLNQGAADRAVQAIEAVIARLEAGSRAAIDELATQIMKSSFAAALSIESAQEDVADAIRRGVPGAAEFQATLDNTARQLDAAQKQLRDAQNNDSLTTDQREAAVRQAQGRIDDINARSSAIDERAMEIRLGRTVGGERATAALSSLQGNQRFANEYAGLTARLARAVAAEETARFALGKAIESGNQAAQQQALAQLNAARNASDVAAALAEAAIAMENGVARLRKVLDGALSDSERIADDAQRQFTQNPTAANRQARDEAERRLIQDRRRVAQANNAIDERRSQLMLTDPSLIRINAEIESIRQARERDAFIARLPGGEGVDPESERWRLDRLAQLEAQRQAALFDLTAAERDAADEIAREIDARARLIAQLEKERQFDEEVRNRQNPVGDPMRGLDLLETPSQRAARDAAQQAADAIAAFDEQVRGLFDANGGLPNESILAQSADLRKQLNDGLNEVFSSAARGAAPAIADLFDQVQNAVAQGPSRAALNVSDVSTQEGSRELTRLLRGDDAARNVNIAQLERQNQSLIKIIEVMTKVEQKMGVTIDLK